MKNLEDFPSGGALGERIEEIKDAVIVMDYESAVEMIQKLFPDARQS